MLRVSYLLVAFLVALSAQPSLARTHSAASRHAYRHYRHHALAWSHGGVVHKRYAFAGADDESWSREDSRQQENSWQQGNSWSQEASWRQDWNGPSAARSFGDRSQIQSLAEQQASANGIPVSLVNRVIRRESGGNPRAVSRGNYGLMQIRLGTARAMGYSGSAQGLLDASTNMTYAVRYLAGAYRAAGGNESRAVALYARGYRATPRVQEASYYSEGPRDAAFTGGGYDDSFAPRMVRHVRHHRHRVL